MGPGLLSFNVDQGEADVAALAAPIRMARPDVVVLPEAAERYRALVATAIPDLGYRSLIGAAPDADGVHPGARGDRELGRRASPAADLVRPGARVRW